MNIIRKYNTYGAAHQTPKSIVIHAMGEYILTENGKKSQHATDFLMSEGLSAHALVAPDATIYRLRNDDEGAYHARGFNAGSLGLEVLVSGRHDTYSFTRAIETHYMTDSQYQAVLDQCREWIGLYGITNIQRHSDVSPGRKSDPGAGFPWIKFLKDLKG